MNLILGLENQHFTAIFQRTRTLHHIILAVHFPHLGITDMAGQTGRIVLVLHQALLGRHRLAILRNRQTGIVSATGADVIMVTLVLDVTGVIQVHHAVLDVSRTRVDTVDVIGLIGTEQDGQEGVRRVGKQRCKQIDRTAGINVCKTVVVHEVQGIHDTHEEARSNDCRDDGNEDIAQGLDEPLEPVALLCCGSLYIFLAACRDAALLDESVKHLVYNACAEDDL